MEIGYVEIRYVQTTYIINENEGQVEVCVSAYPVDVYYYDIMILVEAFYHLIYIPSGATLASE